MTRNDSLSSVLFGKARRGVLSLFFSHSDEMFYLRQVVQLTGLGLGPIQRELKQLSDAGIINRKAQGRQIYFQANKECPIFNELKSIVIKTVGIGDALRDVLTPLAGRIGVAFMYGSFAEGKEKEGSDVDVFIVGDVTFGEVVDAFQGVQDTIGREINPTVYPPEEISSKIAKNKHFLKSVFNGPMIFLVGDKDELERLAQ